MHPAPLSALFLRLCYLILILIHLVPTWASPTRSPKPETMASSPSSTTPQSASNATIYFGYGSNLWLHQMKIRCPTSAYLGVARLNGYRWIINERGYANVVERSSSNDVFETDGSEGQSLYGKVVFGLVYSLEAEDERRLDGNEGVPVAYTKEWVDVDFWAGKGGKKVDVEKRPMERNMLVYVDRNKVEESEPKDEYVHRMNEGIRDAVEMGVPEKYVEDVMRKFIPEEKGDGVEEVKQFALQQARQFVDEN